VLLSYFVQGAWSLAGKRFTLTNYEALTLQRVLEMGVASFDRQLGMNNNPVQTVALLFVREKIALLYAKLFPEQINRTLK
jgi:hypothetical protein